MRVLINLSTYRSFTWWNHVGNIPHNESFTSFKTMEHCRAHTRVCTRYHHHLHIKIPQQHKSNQYMQVLHTLHIKIEKKWGMFWFLICCDTFGSCPSASLAYNSGLFLHIAKKQQIADPKLQRVICKETSSMPLILKLPSWNQTCVTILWIGWSGRHYLNQSQQPISHHQI